MAADWEFKPYTKTFHRSGYPAIDPSNPANSVAGRVVVVTGGGAGVGKEISKAFVTAGAKAVAILGRREDVLIQAKTELEAAGSSKILTFKADVVDAEELNSAFATIKREVGPIDIVVANAGYLPTPAPAAEANIADWWKAFEVNVKGTLLTFQAFAPNKSDKQPVFISLNTGAAHFIFPTFSAYSASKLASAHLVNYLQAENQDVRCVCYHPGVLETAMNAKSQMPMSLDDMSLPAGFAVWLASPKASFVKGKFLWAHWDVEELEAQKEKLVGTNELTVQLEGYIAS